MRPPGPGSQPHSSQPNIRPAAEPQNPLCVKVKAPRRSGVRTSKPALPESQPTKPRATSSTSAGQRKSRPSPSGSGVLKAWHRPPPESFWAARNVLAQVHGEPQRGSAAAAAAALSTLEIPRAGPGGSLKLDVGCDTYHMDVLDSLVRNHLPPPPSPCAHTHIHTLLRLVPRHS